MLPNHEAKGITSAEIQAVNLSQTANLTKCRARYYAGCMVIEIQSVDGWMRFITDSLDDMKSFSHGVKDVICKVKNTED